MLLAGTAPDSACLARAEKKFVRAFGAADARGGCLTTGDAADARLRQPQLHVSVRAVLLLQRPVVLYLHEHDVHDVHESHLLQHVDVPAVSALEPGAAR